jgi:hypothetical protein
MTAATFLSLLVAIAITPFFIYSISSMSTDAVCAHRVLASQFLSVHSAGLRPGFARPDRLNRMPRPEAPPSDTSPQARARLVTEIALNTAGKYLCAACFGTALDLKTSSEGGRAGGL